MLTLKDIRVVFDGFALEADLEIPQGARVAVLGPSGAGKSTLLAAISGFQPLAFGQIAWADQPLPVDPAKRPVSTVFQDNNLFPHLTVAQNVGLGLRPNLKLTAEDQSRVTGALARVGLEGMDSRKPGQLSGGQIARVALARVLLQNRPVLLLDEPFGALGPALKAEMLELVRDLVTEAGTTLLMVSHTPEDARILCDQVVLVAEGRAHAPVPTKSIFDNPPDALKEYLGQA